MRPLACRSTGDEKRSESHDAKKELNCRREARAKLKEMAASVYHEARHAEQVFRAARYMAGLTTGWLNRAKYSAQKLAKQLSIPPEVAQDAKKNPSPRTGCGADRHLRRVNPLPGGSIQMHRCLDILACTQIGSDLFPPLKDTPKVTVEDLTHRHE